MCLFLVPSLMIEVLNGSCGMETDENAETVQVKRLEPEGMDFSPSLAVSSSAPNLEHADADTPLSFRQPDLSSTPNQDAGELVNSVTDDLRSPRPQNPTSMNPEYDLRSAASSQNALAKENLASKDGSTASFKEPESLESKASPDGASPSSTVTVQHIGSSSSNDATITASVAISTLPPPPMVGAGPGAVVGAGPGVNGATTSSASSSASSAASATNQNFKGNRPDEAVRIFGSKLTPYEHTEIYNFNRIYFVGSQANKRGGNPGAANNAGYDDENGSYHLVPHDHIAYRYEILKIIGKGSFGQVIKAYDHKYQQFVALKLVRNEKRFHRQAEEEIRILDHLRQQDPDHVHNVIHMLDHFNFRNHKCITFELMSINLYELIKKNKFHGFNLTLVRKFAHSMLQCLDLLYRNRLIHCDLKPENVLLKNQNRSSIKVIDFGSSCFENQRIYTYIQSRFYRAPEVILGARYGMPIDMWSLGCILAELLTGYPLLPGEDENDQLALIVELLGVPSTKILESGKRTRNFFSSRGHPRYCQVTQLMDGTMVLGGGRSKRGKMRGPPGSRTWNQALKNMGDELFTDFLKRCLDWDPELRMTPQQALKHPWLRRRLPRPPTNGDSASSTTASSENLISTNFRISD
ncbi:unnamed protein product [Bursaphelenchus xylophilus]|uniref:Dual specificity tyrosine-phosphorylation-regulated kinase mbk-2 n=1 Tax=Bursaphelenchus xylophilus TaxID=6326 RepID=A0A7I8WT37_BURXY|nr:unnamed protein product [Bursaphelenchus xylophilus]CAG9115792.1 unnamed protein product [Bursaphelenchus xylophilus]